MAMLFIFSSCADRKPAFAFTENDQGIALFEADKPVFFYQREPKSLDGRYVCNNYIHPLYSIDGDTLTEEFPSDHIYHRGIYWAWHQVFIDNQSVGNSWIMDKIIHDVVELQNSIQNSSARLDLDVHWKSSALENGGPFIHEHTSILVHPLEDEIRKIDFEISLKALVPGVEIGGADNEIGYGGFCPRIKTPEDLVFTSANGKEIWERGRVVVSPWMDYTGSFGPNNEKSGLTVICHPTTPNYPPPWLLNQRSSMQNVIFPGRYRTELPMNKPVALRYRLILHKGYQNVNIEKLKAGYDQFSYQN